MELHELKSLFYKFEQKYFDGKLRNVQLGWSDKMTLCAGKTYFKTINSWKACDIRLSKPLLSQRPRSDTVNTLLHEMIHAYLNMTMGTTLRESHGPEFRKHMNRINAAEKTKITIYHSFHKEVDKFRIHIYRCDGPCQKKKPYFGILKRAIERPPGPEDFWWSKHSAECWGTFIKISGPGVDKETIQSWKTPTKRAEDPAVYALAVKQLDTGMELPGKFTDCNKQNLSMKSECLSAGKEKGRDDEIVEKIKAKYANQRTTVLLPESSSCRSLHGWESREGYTSSSSKTVDGQKLVVGELNPNYQCKTPTKIKVAKYLAKYQLVVEGKEHSHIHISPDMKLVNGSVVWNYEQRTPSKIHAEKYIERFKNVIKRELGDPSEQTKPYIITPSGHIVYNESETNESSSAQEEPEPPEVRVSSSRKKKKKVIQHNLITRYLRPPESSPPSQSVPSTNDNDDFMISLTPSSEVRKVRRKLYEDDSPNKSAYKIPKLSEDLKYSKIDGRQRGATCTDTDLQNQTSSSPYIAAKDLPVKCSRSLYSDISGERKGNDKLTNKKVSDFKIEQIPQEDSKMDTKCESSSLHHTKEETTKFKMHASECTDDEDRGCKISQKVSDIKKDLHQSSSVPLLEKSNSIDTSKTSCALCGKIVSVSTLQDHLVQCMWDDDLTQEIFSNEKDTTKTDPCDSRKEVDANDSFKIEGNVRGAEEMGILEEIWGDERHSSNNESKNEIFSANDSSSLLSADGTNKQWSLHSQNKQLPLRENSRNEYDKSLLIGYGDIMKKSMDDVSSGISQIDMHNRHKGDKASSKVCVTSTGYHNNQARSRRVNNSQQPGCSKWYTSEKLVSKNKEEVDPDKSLPCPICGNEVIAAELDMHLNFCTVDDLAEVSDRDSDAEDFFSQKDYTSENGTFVQSDRNSSPVICPVCKERMDPEYMEEHIKLCISFMSEDDDFM